MGAGDLNSGPQAYRARVTTQNLKFQSTLPHSKENPVGGAACLYLDAGNFVFLLFNLPRLMSSAQENRSWETHKEHRTAANLKASKLKLLQSAVGTGQGQELYG